MAWYLTVLSRYATFAGRARRREFWTFILINLIVVVVLRLVDAGIGTNGVVVLPGVEHAGIGLLSGLYALATLLPALAVGARRLHDTGRSGWWQAANLVYLLAFVPPTTSALLGTIGGAVGFVVGIVLIVWAATDGQPWTNRYGPSHKLEPSS